ncbi:hypothetical protein AGLY_011825 [Aphis glycines]|uniref:Uncharacterized protein n=1 Tax=Aphis glycines TaxID=307491 RepID=A0A6G0TBA9_APHGL|nr:hypothetical protein AGLY_011825 [Aphis glycines]
MALAIFRYPKVKIGISNIKVRNDEISELQMFIKKSFSWQYVSMKYSGKVILALASGQPIFVPGYKLGRCYNHSYLLLILVFHLHLIVHRIPMGEIRGGISDVAIIIVIIIHWNDIKKNMPIKILDKNFNLLAAGYTYYFMTTIYGRHYNITVPWLSQSCFDCDDGLSRALLKQQSHFYDS